MSGVSTSEYVALSRQFSYADPTYDNPVTFDHVLGKITKM